MIRYPITPCPAPRQVRKDIWDPSPSVQRYRAFKDEVRAQKVKISATPFVVFYMPMPDSWTGKRRDRYRMATHLTPPTLGDLLDGLFEAVFETDYSHLAAVQGLKFWADTGSILVGEIDHTVLMMGVRDA